MLKSRVLRQVVLGSTAIVTAWAGASALSYASEAEPTRSPSGSPSGSPTAEDSAPSDEPSPAMTVPSDLPLGADLESRSECWVWVEVRPGVFEYVNICEDPGNEDDGEDGEWVGPSCDLSHEPYVEFCKGEAACWADIPSPIPEENWPDRGRPSDSAIFTYYECLPPGAEQPKPGLGWIEPYDESLPGLGWAAFGKLQTPAFTLSFEPAGMTYVGAETTFSVDGIGDGEIIGGVAGPLQATGTLSHVEIDPGDSTGTFDCDPDLRADCVHIYEEMSHDQLADDLDDRPSYTAQARLVYDVTFTMNGQQLDMPGVPEQLESPWNGTLVPVGEIQVLVE